jgi:2-oxoisovalerate dehydrogenase E1 component beta subunit
MSGISAASSAARQGAPAASTARARCFDTPISELGIVGAAIGMAAYGSAPCVEIQFADYMYPAYDQIVSEAARLAIPLQWAVHLSHGGSDAHRWRHLRGQTHSQSPEALFTHVPAQDRGALQSL